MNFFQSIDTEADSIGILYGDVNFTSYDEDLFDVEVNETSDDDWVTNKDTMYLLDEVFHNLYMHVNRSAMSKFIYVVPILSRFGPSVFMEDNKRGQQYLASDLDRHNLIVTCSFKAQ